MRIPGETGVKSYHERIEVDRALCVYLLAKSEGLNFNCTSNNYSEICSEINDLFFDRKKLLEREVRSLLRHCSHNKLKMIDFLPGNLERVYEKVLEELAC